METHTHMQTLSISLYFSSSSSSSSTSHSLIHWYRHTNTRSLSLFHYIARFCMCSSLLTKPFTSIWTFFSVSFCTNMQSFCIIIVLFILSHHWTLDFDLHIFDTLKNVIILILGESLSHRRRKKNEFHIVVNIEWDVCFWMHIPFFCIWSLKLWNWTNARTFISLQTKQFQQYSYC